MNSKSLRLILLVLLLINHYFLLHAMDSESNNFFIKLQGHDGIIVPVPLNIARMSTTLNNMLSDLGDSSISSSIVLPILCNNSQLIQDTFNMLSQCKDFDLEQKKELIKDFSINKLMDYSIFLHYLDCDMQHVFNDKIALIANDHDLSTSLQEFAHYPDLVNTIFIDHILNDLKYFILKHNRPSEISVNNYIEAIKYSPNGQIVAVGTQKYKNNKNNLLLYTFNEKENTYTLLQSIKADLGCVNAIAFTPDNKSMVVGSYHGKGNCLLLYSLNENGSINIDTPCIPIDTHSPQDTNTEADRANTIAFSPNGTIMAVGLYNGKILIYNFNSKDTIRTPSYALTGHSGRVNGFSFSNNGRMMVSCSSERENNLFVWNINNNIIDKKPITLNGHRNRVLCALFAHNSNRIFSGSDHEDMFYVWNIDNQENIHYTKIAASDDNYDGGIQSLALSGDDKFLSIIQRIGCRGRINLCDINNLDKITRFKIIGNTLSINMVEFSPDAKHMINTNSAKEFILWTLLSTRQEAVLHSIKKLNNMDQILLINKFVNIIKSRDNLRQKDFFQNFFSKYSKIWEEIPVDIQNLLKELHNNRNLFAF